jgi:hypothetical protein
MIRNSSVSKAAAWNVRIRFSEKVGILVAATARLGVGAIALLIFLGTEGPFLGDKAAGTWRLLPHSNPFPLMCLHMVVLRRRGNRDSAFSMTSSYSCSIQTWGCDGYLILYLSLVLYCVENGHVLWSEADAFWGASAAIQSQDSSVRIMTGRRVGDRGLVIVLFTTSFWVALWSNKSRIQYAPGFLSRGFGGRGVKLTTYFYLILR